MTIVTDLIGNKSEAYFTPNKKKDMDSQFIINLYFSTTLYSRYEETH